VSDAAGPAKYLNQVLGKSGPQAHDHDLHSSTQIGAALGAHGRILRAEPSAYYFRYVMPALGDESDLAEAVLGHELEMIAAGAIDPLGRRIVAAAHA